MASTGTAVAPTLDLLVVDEAHRMRNPDTLLHRIGRTRGARREGRRNLAVYSSGKRQSLLSGNRIGPERCAKIPLPLIWQIPRSGAVQEAVRLFPHVVPDTGIAERRETADNPLATRAQRLLLQTGTILPNHLECELELPR